MPEMRTYCIRSRFFTKEDGWITEDVHVRGWLGEAGWKASEIATALDARFGGDQHWTVDLYHLDDNLEPDGLGSYYQLFHGRLR